MTSDPDPTPETENAGGDSVSDPADDDGSTSDWSGEGGATENGPATGEDDAGSA